MKAVLIAFLAVAVLASQPGIVHSVEFTANNEIIAKSEHVKKERVGVDIATIVNVALTVWDIIKENAPVINYATDYANAIPKDAGWLDLENFTDTKYGPFGWVMKDVLNLTLVEFKFYFSYACQGSYEGHGKFLDNVTPSIEHIYAANGWTVNVNTTIPERPTNYGTRVDPIAGLQVLVTLDARSVLQQFVHKCHVSIKGDCSVTILGCNGYD